MAGTSNVHEHGTATNTVDFPACRLQDSRRISLTFFASCGPVGPHVAARRTFQSRGAATLASKNKTQADNSRHPSTRATEDFQSTTPDKRNCFVHSLWC